MHSLLQRLWGALLMTAVLGASASAQTAVVYSNSAAGDLYTNVNLLPIGSSGWAYGADNLGYIGIRTDLPRNGNGSAWMKAINTDAEDNARAEIGVGGLNRPLGKLGDLNTLKYDWYRKGNTNVWAYFHPVLRLYIDADGNTATLGDIGYLVFERAYNPANNPPTAPEDVWITEDLFAYNSGQGANVWQGVLTGPKAGMKFDSAGPNGANWVSLTTWQGGYTPVGSRNGYTDVGLTFNANSLIIGVSMGIGSGWEGTFEGAVDNLVIGLGGQNPYTVTYNFEVVPEPATMALFGLGLAAVGGLVRRKKA